MIEFDQKIYEIETTVTGSKLKSRNGDINYLRICRKFTSQKRNDHDVCRIDPKPIDFVYDFHSD